ncbi:hypothetical protein SBRY_160059 [Actinacidiphila bryophytorum]|uniref:Uncharacterized protein n=1 Tax=Actinacidiphila bryophytorum TaxID=1436133 RepID=A0A9W4E3U3_9ACTN|nr:hypothetical protein SBRY_160059 [Actinacidiphila bryophytorum]
MEASSRPHGHRRHRTGRRHRRHGHGERGDLAGLRPDRRHRHPRGPAGRHPGDPAGGADGDRLDPGHRGPDRLRLLGVARLRRRPGQPGRQRGPLLGRRRLQRRHGGERAAPDRRPGPPRHHRRHPLPGLRDQHRHPELHPLPAHRLDLQFCSPGDRLRHPALRLHLRRRGHQRAGHAAVAAGGRTPRHHRGDRARRGPDAAARLQPAGRHRRRRIPPVRRHGPVHRQLLHGVLHAHRDHLGRLLVRERTARHHAGVRAARRQPRGHPALHHRDAGPGLHPCPRPGDDHPCRGRHRLRRRRGGRSHRLHRAGRIHPQPHLGDDAPLRRPQLREEDLCGIRERRSSR